MKLVRTLEELTPELRGGAVAVGNFDGVHRGHVHLVERLREQARRVGGPAVVFTFDPHPAWILRPQTAPTPLTWIERKAELLAELGVDGLVAYPTDERLLNLTAREFFDRILIEALDAKALVEGTNFCFGHDRAGTIDVLRGFAETAGVSLDALEPVRFEGDVVSSSRVRALIAAGELEAAGRLLTRPYRIRGIVRHGAARGAKIGFPTANVDGVDTLLPAPGVYAGRAWVEEKPWPTAVNIGPNPTFGEQAVKIEAHLIGFHGMLYGALLELDFAKQLRPVRKFAGLEELQAQLKADVAAAEHAAREMATRR